VVVSALVLSGCAYFTANEKLRECDKLLRESEVQLKEAIVIIDSLQHKVYELDVELVNTKEDLKECQNSMNE